MKSSGLAENSVECLHLKCYEMYWCANINTWYLRCWNYLRFLSSRSCFQYKLSFCKYNQASDSRKTDRVSISILYFNITAFLKKRKIWSVNTLGHFSLFLLVGIVAVQPAVQILNEQLAYKAERLGLQIQGRHVPFYLKAKTVCSTNRRIHFRDKISWRCKYLLLKIRYLCDLCF